jgi:hypothetical protein
MVDSSCKNEMKKLIKFTFSQHAIFPVLFMAGETLD